MNKQGYLERKTHAGRRNPSGKSTTRDWWMIKHGTTNAHIVLDVVSFSLKDIGRKIRFKVEFVDDNEKTKI